MAKISLPLTHYVHSDGGGALAYLGACILEYFFVGAVYLWFAAETSDVWFSQVGDSPQWIKLVYFSH